MTTTWKNILTFFLYLAVAAVSMADPVPYNHFALISGQLSPFGVVTSTQTVPQTCEWHMFDCARPCGGRCLRPDQQCCQAEMGLYCEVNQDCHPLGCCPAGQLCDQLPGNCIDDESQHMCGSRKSSHPFRVRTLVLDLCLPVWRVLRLSWRARSHNPSR